MFKILKGITSAFGSSNQQNSEVEEPSELFHLPAGRLNFIRPSLNAKLPKECIYLEANLRIERTLTPFHYQLVIERTLEDEDEASEEEDLEKTFLLNEKLEFRVYTTVDDIDDDDELSTVAFSWIDVSSPEISERFEFVINVNHPDCSETNINQAADIIYQCIWESIHEQDSSQAPEEELLALRHNPEDEIIALQQDLTHPQADIIYPSQPSDTPRSPSTQSESSEIQQTLYNHPGLAASIDEYDSEGDQSDSSTADEIVNQLKGTSLKDTIPSSSPSIPRPYPTSPVSQKLVDESSHRRKPESTPLKKFQIISPQYPPSPVQSIPHIKPSTPTTSATHRSQSHVKSTPEGQDQAASLTEDASDLSASSSTDHLTQQELSEGTVELQLPLTDVANEPSPDRAMLSWNSICNLYVFDSDEIGFKLFRSDVIVELLVSRPNQPDRNICWIRVIDPSLNDARLISTNIREENDLVCNNGAIFFNETQAENSYTWVLRFPPGDDQQDQLLIASEAFAKALYERDNGIGTYAIEDSASKGWDRLKYGVIDEEPRLEEDGEEFNEEEEDEESDQDLTSSDDDDEDTQLRKFRAKNTGPKNSQLTVGFKEDVSFVVRGNMLGLFKNEPTYSKKLKFMATIPDICTPDGKRDLIPSKIMLHEQDSTMVLQDPSNPNSLYNLDLGTGKVVEEWKISKEGSIRDFFPRTKFSQMNPEATFLGTSQNSFYTIDPRLSGYKAVSNESKSYKTKTDFSCATTTESGQIALGSNTGEIRLFDSQIGKNAKTLLPAMKDPILAIDVCRDGTFLIATCEKYLVLVDCQLPGSNILGFQKSFPKAEKPVGRRVELTPEHRAQIHSEKITFRFKPAKFNQGLDAVEKTIVTSIGPYIIAFDFRKLKMGQTEYTLKRYEENVVADSFRWDNDKDIVVTMPSSVFMEKRKKLSKPLRESLVFVKPPSRVYSNRPSTSGIRTGHSSLGVVQEWDG